MMMNNRATTSEPSLPTTAWIATAERPTTAVTRKKQGTRVQMWLVGNAPISGPAATPVMTATTAANAKTIAMRPGAAAIWLAENINDAIM